jgi:hypothetical protein
VKILFFIVNSLHLIEVKISTILTAVAAVRPTTAAWEQLIAEKKSECIVMEVLSD